MFNNNLDNILKTFNKTTVRLDSFIQKRQAEKSRAEVQATLQAMRVTELETEVARAETVKQKIADLIS